MRTEINQTLRSAVTAEVTQVIDNFAENTHSVYNIITSLRKRITDLEKNVFAEEIKITVKEDQSMKIAYLNSKVKQLQKEVESY